MTGMLTNAYIVDVAVANAAYRKEPREVPIMAQTKNMLHLLRIKVECSGGNL